MERTSQVTLASSAGRLSRGAGIALGLILLVLFNGGATASTEALAILLVGGLLLLRTRSLPPVPVCWGVLLLIAWSIYQVLPLAWPSAPWQERLNSLGVTFPRGLSLQPWVSLERLLPLLAGVGFALWALAAPWSRRDRLQGLWTLLVGGAFLALVLLAGNGWGIRLPWLAAEEIFTYFPNRNQTAIFFVCLSVLGVGLAWHALAHRYPRRAFAAVALSLLILVGTFSLGSRASLLLALGGIILVTLLMTCSGRLGGGSTGQPAVKRWQIALPVGVLLVGLALAYGAAGVLRLENAVRGDLGQEMRPAIYADMHAMIATHPAGVGLGNFAVAFPQFRDASRSMAQVRHPESDLLWLQAELGWPGLLAVLAFVAWVYQLTRGAWQLRPAGSEMIALAAVLPLVLHAFIDVSWHRMGTALLGCFLLGLATGPTSETGLNDLKTGKRTRSCIVTCTPCLKARWFWRVTGGGLLLAGSCSLLAPLLSLPLGGESAFRLALSKSVAQGPTADLSPLTTWRPLDWRTAFAEGQHAVARGHYREGVEAFRRMRALQPTLAEPAMAEAEVWGPRHPARVLNAWRLALQRDTQSRGLLLNRMRGLAEANPRLAHGLGLLVVEIPELRRTWLMQARGDPFLARLDEELSLNPTLEGFTTQEHASILQRLIAEGQAERVLTWLKNDGQTHAPLLWIVQARALAVLEEWQAASLFLLRHATPPLEPGETDRTASPERLRVEVYRFPEDPLTHTRLFLSLLARDRHEEAEKALASLLERAEPPLFVLYWKARLRTEANAYEEAWPWWEQFLREGEG